MLKILVVAHDAGGANILASLIKKYRKNFSWMTCVSGPARKIFLSEKIDSYAQLLHLKNNNIDVVLKLSQPDLVLTGTGWQSDFEINFIKSARSHGIKTVSFLDHWVHYRERFGYPGRWQKNLPDLIFVGDKWAYEIAIKNSFSKNILIQVENPYFEEIAKKAKSLQNKIRKKTDSKIRILYLSDPIYKCALKYHHNPFYWGYTEYEVIKDLLRVMELLKKTGISSEIRVRFHPAEKINKYSYILMSNDYKRLRKFITLSNPTYNLLIKDCLWADVVIGIDSMALVVALILGKKTVSYSPNNKKICSLPQKEINKIYSQDELLEAIKIFQKNRGSITRKNHKYIGRRLFPIAVRKILGKK